MSSVYSSSEEDGALTQVSSAVSDQHSDWSDISPRKFEEVGDAKAGDTSLALEGSSSDIISEVTGVVVQNFANLMPPHSNILAGKELFIVSHCDIVDYIPVVGDTVSFVPTERRTNSGQKRYAASVQLL